MLHLRAVNRSLVSERSDTVPGSGAYTDHLEPGAIELTTIDFSDGRTSTTAV